MEQEEINEVLDIPEEVESKGDLIRWLREDLDLGSRTVQEITGDQPSAQSYYLHNIIF